MLPAAPYFRYPQRCVTRTTRVQACADGGKNARGEDTRDSGEDSHELYASTNRISSSVSVREAVRAAKSTMILQSNHSISFERKEVSSHASQILYSPCWRTIFDLARYAGLRQRQAKLAAQRASAEKERELVKELAAEWPHYQRAQLTLFEHWCAEEGVATTLLHATRGGDTALLALIEVYPDWAEPVNQLATLRYMEGKYDHPR